MTNRDNEDHGIFLSRKLFASRRQLRFANGNELVTRRWRLVSGDLSTSENNVPPSMSSPLYLEFKLLLLVLVLDEFEVGVMLRLHPTDCRLCNQSFGQWSIPVMKDAISVSEMSFFGLVSRSFPDQRPQLFLALSTSHGGDLDIMSSAAQSSMETRRIRSSQKNMGSGRQEGKATVGPVLTSLE